MKDSIPRKITVSSSGEIYVPDIPVIPFIEGDGIGVKPISESNTKQLVARAITEADPYDRYDGRIPDDKVVIRDRLADMLFQQILLRPDEFSIIAAPNLNGGYISDALAAQVGDLGMASGANIGDSCAVFEATHGTAPKYAGMDKVNPGSLILSGALMLDHMNWGAAAERIRAALQAAVKDGIVTYDLARQMDGAAKVSCSAFAAAIMDRL